MRATRKEAVASSELVRVFAGAFKSDYIQEKMPMSLTRTPALKLICNYILDRYVIRCRIMPSLIEVGGLCCNQHKLEGMHGIVVSGQMN